ncbi:MAG: nuclear transport factor 2 family protein [Pseudomonadaceae bacterium]|nr:nuclear transport factor 2 family protein [Pseudomonadaceae bacterium]
MTSKTQGLMLCSCALLLASLTSLHGNADNDPTLAANNVQASTLQQEIDATVWAPFREAFHNLDGEALNAVYADDVLRVTPAGIDEEEKFKAYNRMRFEENVRRRDQVQLDFWFDSRHTNQSSSYEVGFYRLLVEGPSGEASAFYGQFHIVLAKIGDHWKIVQDWDTDSIGGLPITSADFSRRQPKQF